MRIVHAADIHLDSQLRGLERLGEEAASTLRRATRGAFANLVDLVRDNDADILVIAGDLYDGDWNDFATGAYFVSQMDILHQLGVPVVVASGNHDAESQITRSLRLPDNVRLLSTQSAESVHFQDLGLVVHGQGYATRDVTQNLAAAYPKRVAGMVNVGVLHTAVAGAPGHASYAPCTAAELEALQYDYFALGHVHQRQAVLEGPHPAWFSGNLQGRHARETGPKGALVIDFDSGGPATPEFRPLDVARWEDVVVDVTGLTDTDAALDAARAALDAASGSAEGRYTVARLRLIGSSAIASRFQDAEWINAEAEHLGGLTHTTVEKVVVNVSAPKPPDPTAARLRTSIADAAVLLSEDPAALSSVTKVLDRSIREIAAGTDAHATYGLDLADSDTVVALLERAVQALDAHLSELDG